MSPLAQRIAIAEICGTHTVVKGMRPSLSVPIYRMTDRRGKCADYWENGSVGDLGFEPPPHESDLNAMHVAWCSLTADQHRIFRRHLAEVVTRDGHVCGPCRSLSNATATQRCEAFLKTVGKWVEA